MAAWAAYAVALGFVTAGWALNLPPRAALWVGTNSSVSVGWDCAKTWDGGDVMGQDGNNTCKLLQVGEEGKALYACSSGDVDKNQGNASLAPKSYYSRHGCSGLESWWQRLPDMSLETNTRTYAPCLKENDTAHTVSKLFVDTGVGIGACLLQMLNAPDVEHAVGFEPNPVHLYYLTSSMLASASVKDKLSLYPFPLGDSVGVHTLFMGKRKGQTQGETGLDWPESTESRPVGEVITRTLDDVFLSSGRPPYIHLLNIADVGYAVKTVMGARRLLGSGAVNAVKLVFSTDQLKAQHANPVEYLNIFLRSGFDFYPSALAGSDKPLASGKLSLARLHELACSKSVVMHMVAVFGRDGDHNGKGLGAC